MCTGGRGGLLVGLGRGGGIVQSLISFLGERELRGLSVDKRIMQMKSERLTNGGIMATDEQGQLV